MQFIDFNYYQATSVQYYVTLRLNCPTGHRYHTIMQILHDLHCDYFSPTEKRDIMRPGAAIARTRDTKLEIRDMPGNTGLLATLGIDGIEIESTKMGMRINIDKTDEQLISKRKTEMNITVRGNKLKQVREFVYLSGKFDEEGGSKPDVQRRIGLACDALKRLNKIWRSRDSIVQAPKSKCMRLWF